MVFSAYKCDQDNVPIDNLDEVPISGNIEIQGKGKSATRVEAREKVIESEVLRDPTWLDQCAIANAHLIQRIHRRQLYLESVHVVGVEGHVKIVEICLRP